MNKPGKCKNIIVIELSEINRSLMFGWSASYTSSLISNHDNRNSRAMLMYIFEFIVI